MFKRGVPPPLAGRSFGFTMRTLQDASEAATGENEVTIKARA